MKKRFVIENERLRIGEGNSLVRPFPGNGKGPPGILRQNEGVDGTDIASLENPESLSSKTVKGMSNLCPSQILAEMMCCCLELSQRWRTALPRR
jgi:hypothetical protein